jgi:hypothetical protein
MRLFHVRSCVGWRGTRLPTSTIAFIAGVFGAFIHNSGKHCAGNR